MRVCDVYVYALKWRLRVHEHVSNGQELLVKRLCLVSKVIEATCNSFYGNYTIKISEFAAL